MLDLCVCVFALWCDCLCIRWQKVVLLEGQSDFNSFLPESYGGVRVHVGPGKPSIIMNLELCDHGSSHACHTNALVFFNSAVDLIVFVPNSHARNISFCLTGACVRVHVCVPRHRMKLAERDANGSCFPRVSTHWACHPVSKQRQVLQKGLLLLVRW